MRVVTDNGLCLDGKEHFKSSPRMVCYFFPTPSGISRIAMKSQSFPGNSSLDRRNVEVKIEEVSGKGSIDLRLGDEALRLVDAEKIAEFDEEYNLELRKKLVGVGTGILCLFFYWLGLGHTSHLCLSVLFSVFVSQFLSFVPVRFHDYRDKTSLNYARYPFTFLV